MLPEDGTPRWWCWHTHTHTHHRRFGRRYTQRCFSLRRYKCTPTSQLPRPSLTNVISSHCDPGCLSSHLTFAIVHGSSLLDPRIWPSVCPSCSSHPIPSIPSCKLPPNAAPLFLVWGRRHRHLDTAPAGRYAPNASVHMTALHSPERGHSTHSYLSRAII